MLQPFWSAPAGAGVTRLRQGQTWKIPKSYSQTLRDVVGTIRLLPCAYFQASSCSFSFVLQAVIFLGGRVRRIGSFLAASAGGIE